VAATAEMFTVGRRTAVLYNTYDILILWIKGLEVLMENCVGY